MRKGFIYLLIAILLAGCASAAQSTMISKGPLDAQTTPTAGAVSQPTPDQGMPVIVMERSGGIAGIHNKWTIYASGQVIMAGQVVRTLAADQVNTTMADIQKLGFFEMQADYSKNSNCMDCFLDVVTINSGGNSKTVTAVEGDARTPAEFLKVIEDINKLTTVPGY